MRENNSTKAYEIDITIIIIIMKNFFFVFSEVLLVIEKHI
jgi:hypothetical protein